MSAAGDSESGVTLLEALVVIAIVALVAGLIAPNMRTSLGVLSLRQTAAVLQADLRVAHATAMRTGNPTSTQNSGESSWQRPEQPRSAQPNPHLDQSPRIDHRSEQTLEESAEPAD